MAEKMRGTSKSHKKEILRDPVSKYLKQKPGADADGIADLNNLHQQYSNIESQFKDSQDMSKKISRQIGEAKREALPCEDLMQTMRKRSDETKRLKAQLADISDQILNYFGTRSVTDEAANNNTRNQADDFPPVRVHNTRSPDAGQISIKQLTDEHEAWNRYVESNPASSLYHRAEWKDLIHDVFGHECVYFYASCNTASCDGTSREDISNDIKVVGILPLVRLNSRLFGNFMVSMPYFNSGGAIADSLMIEQALMQTASQYAKKFGAEHIEYRDDISRDGMPVRDEKVNMILALPDAENILWDRFSSKLRSQIRRAQRENITVNIGGTECVDDFYSVFAQNMRDLGTPVYGKNFFDAISQRFNENSAIVIVRLHNKPVAAAFLLGHNDSLEIPWASTIKQANHLSVNMLLYWEVLKFAMKNRYHYFDFGRSSKDSGTFHFKQQWGAKPKQCFWHYWLKDNTELPELNPNNPKFKLLISIWKKIPVCITKCIGPSIVKNLP